MNCPDLCVKCEMRGEIDANFAGFHKYCKEHYKESVRRMAIVECCVHCEAEFMIVLQTCEFCMEAASSDNCVACKCRLCDECLKVSCKFCFYRTHICGTCQAFSEQVRKQKCGHSLCEVCSEEEDRCEECHRNKVCGECGTWNESTKERVKGKSICEKCWGASGKCPCGLGLTGQCRICENYKKQSKNESAVGRNGSGFENLPTLGSGGRFEACMGCSIYKSITTAQCGHDLCSDCIKKPCKMCEIDKPVTPGNNWGEWGAVNPVKKQINTEGVVPKDICIMCNKFSQLEKKSCEHPRCSECRQKACEICKMLDEPGTNNKKNEKRFPNSKKSEKNTPNSNKPEKNFSNSNKFENNLINSIKPENNLLTCHMCKEKKEINQHRKCGHDICNSCVNKPCCKKEKKNKSKKDDIIGVCAMCKREKISITKTFCEHYRCHSCINLECEECYPKKCRSCNAISEELRIHYPCGKHICVECEYRRCLVCNPYNSCSNCGKESEGIELNCIHKFLCFECSVFVENKQCIFHGDDLQHCSNHGVCKFSIVQDDFISKDCNNQVFCLYCKKKVKKNSERKKHNKCKKSK